MSGFRAGSGTQVCLSETCYSRQNANRLIASSFAFCCNIESNMPAIESRILLRMSARLSHSNVSVRECTHVQCACLPQAPSARSCRGPPGTRHSPPPQSTLMITLRSIPSFFHQRCFGRLMSATHCDSLVNKPNFFLVTTGQHQDVGVPTSIHIVCFHPFSRSY